MSLENAIDYENLKRKMKNIGRFKWDITENLLTKYSINSGSIFFTSDQLYKIWMEFTPVEVTYVFNFAIDGIRNGLIGGTIGLLISWNLIGIIIGTSVGILSKILLLCKTKYDEKVIDYCFNVLIFGICCRLTYLINERFIGAIGGLFVGLLYGTVGMFSVIIGEMFGGIFGAIICLILSVIFEDFIKFFIDKIHKILFEQIIGIYFGRLFSKRFGGLLDLLVTNLFDKQKIGIKFNISTEDETRFGSKCLVEISIKNKCMPHASQIITKLLKIQKNENSLIFALSLEDLNQAGVIQKSSVLNRMFIVIESTVYVY